RRPPPEPGSVVPRSVVVEPGLLVLLLAGVAVSLGGDPRGRVEGAEGGCAEGVVLLVRDDVGGGGQLQDRGAEVVVELEAPDRADRAGGGGGRAVVGDRGFDHGDAAGVV